MAFNFFKKKREPDKNSIRVYLDGDEIKYDVEIVDFEEFGNLLYLLFNGYLDEQVIESIFSGLDIESIKKLQDVINSIDDEEGDDNIQPLISPLSFGVHNE